MVNYYFYNTDAGSLAGEARFHTLIQHGFAATGGPRRFGEQLGQLVPGDILLMYENGVGIVAIGEVLEPWDGRSHQDMSYYKPGDKCVDEAGHRCEYRINVRWRGLSGGPISVQEIKERLGYTPRGAVRKIVKWRAEIERMTDEL